VPEHAKSAASARSASHACASWACSSLAPLAEAIAEAESALKSTGAIRPRASRRTLREGAGCARASSPVRGALPVATIQDQSRTIGPRVFL
jgi:hypothetical protein